MITEEEFVVIKQRAIDLDYPQDVHSRIAAADVLALAKVIEESGAFVSKEAKSKSSKFPTRTDRKY